MAVPVPVGGTKMDFNISGPDRVPNPEPGIKKVGASIGILFTRM
jgi:hypothetical protein